MHNGKNKSLMTAAHRCSTRALQKKPHFLEVSGNGPLAEKTKGRKSRRQKTRGDRKGKLLTALRFQQGGRGGGGGLRQPRAPFGVPPQTSSRNRLGRSVPDWFSLYLSCGSQDVFVGHDLASSGNPSSAAFRRDQCRVLLPFHRAVGRTHGEN